MLVIKEKSKLIIFKDNSIREYITKHLGTEDETTIGDCNLFIFGLILLMILSLEIILLWEIMLLSGGMFMLKKMLLSRLTAVHHWCMNWKESNFRRYI